MDPTAQILLYLLRIASVQNNLNIFSNSQNSSQEEMVFSALLQAALTNINNNSNNTEAMGITKKTNPKNSSRMENAAIDNSYGKIIEYVSKKYDVDANLIREVIAAESGFDAKAVSRAGAQGLMQLMPGTAAQYGVSDPFNPLENIDGGTHFLSDLLKRYEGDVKLALAAYNAGPGAVNKYKGVPPYRETQNYVNKIISNLEGLDERV